MSRIMHIARDVWPRLQAAVRFDPTGLSWSLPDGKPSVPLGKNSPFPTTVMRIMYIMLMVSHLLRAHGVSRNLGIREG